jgi:uncharacterized protein YjiS (DUF1127 family)
MSHNAINPAYRRRPAADRTPSFGNVTDAITACWRAVLRHRATRRDAHFLLSQPDYILRDIGIGRGEIEAAVRGRRRG